MGYTSKIIELLDGDKGEEYKVKVIGRSVGCDADTARSLCERLQKQQRIGKRYVGSEVFYYSLKAKPTIKKEEKAEDILLKTLGLKDEKITGLHKIFLIFQKERTLTKMIGSLLSKFDVFRPNSLYQSWRGKRKQISGGFQSSYPFRQGTITVQIWGTGSFQATFDTSDTPMPPEDWNALMSFLDGLFVANADMPISDVKDYLEVLFEISIDGRKEEYAGSGKFSITLRQFDDYIQRVYLKDEKEGLVRNEVARQTPMGYNDFVESVIAPLQGGVNFQYMIRNQHQIEQSILTIEKNILDITKRFDKRDRVIEHLLKENLKNKKRR